MSNRMDGLNITYSYITLESEKITPGFKNMPSFLTSIALTALGLVEDAPLCPTFSFGVLLSIT